MVIYVYVVLVKQLENYLGIFSLHLLTKLFAMKIKLVFIFMNIVCF